LEVASDYRIIAILILAVIALATVIIIATHLIGPKRHGAVKDATYEAGVDPVGDARRRFNVRFYLIAVLFLVFDVEILFLYPWATLYPRLGDATREGATHTEWAGALADAGFGSGFFLVSIGIFFVLLGVGFVYEWRKGIFRWD